MANTETTILIPDISGFTEFMTNTELSHSSHVINTLIEAIVKSVEDEYEVSEIEGDAVLFIKKGPAPSEKEIVDSVIKIFNAFHFMRKWMNQHAICPCGACLSIDNLTLKFIVHYGEVAEMKVGRFVKQSGTEMIVAHRLLKNSIQNNEYLLISEKLFLKAAESKEKVEMEWNSSSEEYPVIGNVKYRYALLNEVRKNIPEPAEPERYYRKDDTKYLDINIAANYRDIYMVLMNIPGRPQWLHDLLDVGQNSPEVFIGSVHHCKFENFKTVISPLRMNYADDGIIYAESCRIEELNLYLVHEFVFKKINDKESQFSSRFMNMNDAAIPSEINSLLLKNMEAMSESLKEHCEKMETSLFEPDFHFSNKN